MLAFLLLNWRLDATQSTEVVKQPAIEHQLRTTVFAVGKSFSLLVYYGVRYF